MAKTVKYDATKMGPLSWRQLQLANQEAYANLDIDDDLRSALQQVTNNMSIPNSGSPEINWEGRVQSPIMRNSNGRDYWGNSMWDEQVADANDFENNLSDLRGQNQPWYAQLGAGLLKSVTTAATTWLDGTVGLLYGIGAAAGTALFDDNATGWDAAAKIFHNSVSDSLQDFNEFMEEFAPNYKSRDEENNKWYQNMGTMNFWADGLIKNLGFTVGAFYSGALFTKALKVAGGLIAAGKAGKAVKAYKAAKIEELMKANPKMTAEEAAKAVSPMATAIKYTNALKAIEGARSGTGIAVAGSLFSAVNEGRIEANQVYRDAFTNTGDWRTSKGAAQEILMNEKRVMQEIAANPNLTEEEKVVLQQQTRDRADALLKQAEQNAAQAGMLTLGLNIPILTLDNFKMYGRLYSRGFKQSVKQVGNNVTTQELKAAQDAVKNATTKQEKEAAQRALKEAERKAKAAHNARNNARVDDVAENVTEKEGRLAWNEITKGQAAWKGIKLGLREGNEEMMQAWASGTAGNMTMPEDPDAYYKALTDPNATIKTNDFLTSLTKGFLDSYGNGDRWEEGAIGFLTGILGMPTFGARANSDSNTYLGRGKMIGLSGGLFGEFSNANYLNRLGAESVKNINAFRDRYKQHAQFLAQSQAFTDAMDGYLQDKNEFAYNNARDDDDYAMIQALAVTGRIDEVKAMLNFKEEDLTDDVLDSIARDFTENSNLVDSDGNPKTVDNEGKPLQGAWRDKAGNLMSKTDEGKAEMKAKLLEKQKRLNEEIDDYVASLDSVRAQVNNSLDESQVRELAWIDWKGKQWSRRFDESVHNGNFINAIDTLASNTQNLMDQMSGEKNFTESKEYKALKNFNELLAKVKTAKNPMELLGIMGKNNAFYNALFDSIYNNNPDAKVTEKLPLIALLGGVDGSLNAVNEIGKTLADIRFMVTAQQQFKKKLDEYISNPTKLAENRARIDNERQQQQDITETINNKPQNLDSNKLRSFLDMDEDSFKQWEASASMPSGISGISEEEKAMVTEASKIRKTYQRLLANINSNTKLSAEEKKQVAALVTASYNKATSYENFLDTSNEAYNDPNNALVDAEGLNSTEIANLKQSIIDKNQQVLSELIGNLDRMPDLPKTGETVEGNIQGTFSTTPTTTGNSQVSTPSESENERVERERKEKEKKEVEKNRRKKLGEYIHELAELFATNKRDTAKMYLWSIADGFIDSYLKSGEFPKVNPAVSGAKASNAFERLLSLCDNDSQKEWLDRRTINKLYLRVNQLYNPVVIAQLEKEAAEAVKREQAGEKKEKENPVTHIVTVEEVEEINNRELVKHNAEPKDMTYWKPTTTEYGIGQAYEKGKYTKFSDRAASMNNYDEQTKRRIAAVSQYFNDKGVWDRVNSGNDGKMDVSSKESVVYFKIDPKLNEAAGEIVILITDKEGNVLGDIMSKNDGRFAEQKYLPNFVAYVEEQYKGHENDGSPFVPVNTTTGEPLATKINKCMIGKVPYSNEYVTLNEANDTTIDDTNKQHKYFLGIAVTDNNGKTIVKATSEKSGSLGYIDRMIEQPVGDIVSGTPFLLVKSEGRDVYMCVPFITPVFDEEHYQEIMDSLYGSVIRKAISEIEKTVKNDKIAQKNKPYKIKDILTELFASSKFYVDYNSSTNTYTFKLEGADFYANVSFEDNPAEGQLKFSVSDFLQNIAKKGLGLQISRRYINGNEARYDENGQVYFNKALGSIAKVNIKPMSQIQSNNSGHTSYLHTIDDWFVIDPLDIQTVNGTVTIKRVQAVAPVSTKNNPNAKPKTIVNVVVDNIPVKVDLENKTATVGNTTFSLKNSKAYSEKDKEQIKKAKIAYAKAFAEAHPNSIKSNIITTPFGEFNTKNNAFINDTSASDNDNGLGEVDDNFFASLANVKQQGQKVGTFNSQAQSTPTTTQTTTEQQPTNGEKSYAEKSGFVFRPVSEWKQEHSLIQVYPDGKTVDTLQFRSEVEAKRVALAMLTMFKSAKDYQDLHDKLRSKGWSMPVTDWTTTYGYWEAFKDGRISEQDVLDLFTPNSNSRVSVPASQTTTQQTSEQQSTTPQVSEQEVEQKPEPTAEEVLEKKSEESLDKRAEDFGLFDIEGGKGRKVWNVLSDEQKEAIVSKDNLQATAALECLCTLFDGKKGKFKKKNTDVDGVIAKYKRVTDQPTTLWNKEQEIAWLKKALPQFSNEERLQIVDGLIKIADKDNPGYAWGQFYRGLITISSEAASGTLYHEAFHAVIDLLMTEDEYNKLFDAAYQVWGNLGMLGLEEKLAEEFRKFVQYGDNAAFVDYDAEDIKTPIIRGIVRLFRRLKALIQGLSNKQIYLNKLFYDINKGKFADRKIKENKLDKVTTRQEEDAQLVLDRNPELASVGTAREYAAYVNDIFPNSVEKDIYWHGSNEDFSDGFNTAKRGEGSGALETKKRNDLYLNKQGWASLQYVNGVNRQGSDKNGFAHWNKLWWELKEIMSNGRRENNDWKDIVITDKDVNSIRQAIPNKRGKFDRDKGGTHGKWLKERKADYGYENKSDKEFFEEVFGLQLGKDTFNTWTARNAEVFKAMETTAKGIYPVVINVTNPIVEEGQNTYYEEQRGLFSQADRNGNDAILSRSADNEFNSDVAVVINANNKNVHWLGTKSDIEQFKQWKAKNVKQPKFDINERELEDIKKRAIADGTFMKAPNGKPTNLNERQWLQVRTKAFKDWFGDWESFAKAMNQLKEFDEKIDLYYENIHTNQGIIDDVIDSLKSNNNFKGLKVFTYKGKSYSFNNNLNSEEDKKEIEQLIKQGLLEKEDKWLYFTTEGKDAFQTVGFDPAIAFEDWNSEEEAWYDTRSNTNLSKDYITKAFQDLYDNINRLKEDSDKAKRERDKNAKMKAITQQVVYALSNPVSKVVDENGEPLVVYNASPTAVTTYKEGVNFFSSDINYVKSHKATDPYTNEEVEVGYGKNINGVFLNIKNPEILSESDGLNTSMAENIIKSDSSIDGIIGHDAMFNENIDLGWVSEGTEYVTSNPNQVKSATDNVGTFSKENNDIRYSRVKTELDNKVAEFAEAINKSIAETMTLNRYAQNWDYTKNIPLRKPDASNNDGRKAYFGIKNPMHFYKGQWTISNGAAKYGGKDYHNVVKNEVFRRLAMVGMLDKFNALFDVEFNKAINHYVIKLKTPEAVATIYPMIEEMYNTIPDDVLADMIMEEEKRKAEIINTASSHTKALFENNDKITLSKLFENLINAGVNRNRIELYRNILDKLGELGNIEVGISDSKDSRFSDGKAAGYYISTTNSIVLKNNLADSFLEDCIVHEALHAVVFNTTKDEAKVQEINTIVEGIRNTVLQEYNVKSIDDIEDAYIRRLFYGLTNADEFVSEFFSNVNFREYIKDKTKPWYIKFFDFIKRTLGIKDLDITKELRNLLADFDGTVKANRTALDLSQRINASLDKIATLMIPTAQQQEEEKPEKTVKQYHIEKLMYENLSESDKEYIKEKGLSKTEYDEFSMIEKESFWYCR